MERGEFRGSGKRRRKCCLILCVAVILIIIIAVVLSLTLRQETSDFKTIFLDRCKKFKENNCENIWEVFQKIYVNRDPCQVPMEAYDPLITAAPFKPSCNKTMFWSKTKDVVHSFTEKRDCFLTMEDTLLGSVLDGLTWCGKEGSNETLTTGCPGWTECENNTVRSFWNRASAEFADTACGNVTVMLNGSIMTPFDSRSIFGSIEVKRFNSKRVRNLNVLLVMQKNAVVNCTTDSLQELQKVLDKGIKYNCKEVPESLIEECSSHPEKPCESCW
ncbi:ADP-ribosyl cyclase/cyclic ADP-ribose hydrolase 1-like [Melanotaenia boesemani]|uniref:ADP-ribosyl cyclase/cyclic ADP-ribose hydrolase 1-like n=1 Tax=Melanotaenia boesemani TaxID=1250792 RepID=UPI001C04D6F9|nr:ADP-ribosyl cyclase/cyclic ADP-ribose hydrolase 1-like [Melanotaenia boesemani]